MFHRIADFRLHGSDYPYHIHGDVSQFMVVVEGTAQQFINGKEITTRRGDVCVLETNCTHAIHQAKDLRIYNIDFYSDELSRRCQDLSPFPQYSMLFQGESSLSTSTQSAGFIQLNHAAMSDALTQLQQMKQEYLSNLPGRQTVLDAQFLLLIASICRQHEKPPMQNGMDDRLHRTLEFINTNYASPLSLSELASHAALSERQFLRIFKDAYGLTPTEYIGKLRIERARDILLETDYPVTTIAIECGFSDSSYFAKYFKKLVGCSPTEYRKHVLNT